MEMSQLHFSQVSETENPPQVRENSRAMGCTGAYISDLKLPSNSWNFSVAKDGVR